MSESHADRIRRLTKDLADKQPGSRGWRSVGRGYACIESSGHDAVNLESDVDAAEQKILRSSTCIHCDDAITWEPKQEAPVPTSVLKTLPLSEGDLAALVDETEKLMLGLFPNPSIDTTKVPKNHPSLLARQGDIVRPDGEILKAFLTQYGRVPTRQELIQLAKCR